MGATASLPMTLELIADFPHKGKGDAAGNVELINGMYWIFVSCWFGALFDIIGGGDATAFW